MNSSFPVRPIVISIQLFALIAGCLFLGTTSGLAQEITGSIVGTVRDTKGANVPGATITITNVDKKIVERTLSSDTRGEYSAPLLPIGNYELTVEAANFKKFVENMIKLDVNQHLTKDATLEAGNIAETVTVESSPLQAETQAVTASTLISGTQARELALNNRNFVQLATLAPGVSSDLPDQIYVGTTRPDGKVNLISISVNGSRSSANNWKVDGADITDRGSNLTIQLYPSIDAISEFKVLRSLYPAEEGRAGGGEINLVTKSGTSGFHGDLYEFVRNDKLNANNFFLNRTTNPNNIDANGKARRPPLRYNNFGYTIGGPIFIPNHYNTEKKKTFFFFSQEWRRTITYQVFRPTVPTGQLRQGIFPADHPACLAFDANGVCTQSTTHITNINPVAQAYINDIFSTLPEPASDFTLTSPQRNVFNFRQEILKVDHNFGKNFSMTYRLELDSIPTIEPNALFSSGSGLPGVSTTKTDSPGRSHVLRFTYIFNPSTIIDGGYAYTYGAIQSQPFGKLLLKNSSVKVPLPFENTLGRIPTLNFNNFSSTSTFGPYDNFSNNHNLFGSVSKIYGKHTMKFGTSFSVLRKHENAAGGNEGSFSFAGDDLYQEWANFLLGNVDTFRQNSRDITNDLRQRVSESYAQDEWRARPNLTVYYGLRYSVFRRPFDTNGFFTNFDPSRFDPTRAFQVDANGNRFGPGDPLNGIIVNNQNSPFGSKVANEDNSNFAPRVGIAWDPFKKGTTSIRTGYGIYHDLTAYAFFQDASTANPPFVNSVTISNTRLDNPAAGSVNIDNSAQSLRAVGLPYHTPYMQHWSLDVQHQIGKRTLLDVGYYGSKGTHLAGGIDINLLPPGKALNSLCVNASGKTVPCQAPGQVFRTGSQELILDQIRPFRGYEAINTIQNRFNSSYHSLQVYLQQRLTGSSQLNVAYTWSKNLTDNQVDRFRVPMNSYDIRSNRSRSQLDRRHILSVNYVYELPFYRQQRGVAGKFLGGWELSGITTYETGLPFTASRSRDPGGLGFLGPSDAGGRPDAIGDPNAGPGTVDQFFNKAAFADVPPGVNRPANSGRGIINGPGLARWDISMFKNLRLHENFRLQFRAEAFNIFNHTNFVGLFTSFSPTSTTFGRVSSAADARIIQFGLKLYY